MLPLFVENGEAIVWNDLDWSILRTKYRICGALIGSSSSVPKQNHKGPVCLMYEETALLVAQGICELFQLPTISNVPNMDVQDPKEIAKNILAQQETINKSRLEQACLRYKIIVASKRPAFVSSHDADDHDKQEGEFNFLPLLPLAPLPHCNTDNFKVGIEALDLEGDNRVINFTTFTDLWEKGYYIMSGSKCGSDYILYPGDPVESQAMYMVWCVKDGTTSFSPTTLITLESLSVAVDKTGLIAYTDESGNIQYQSVKRLRNTG